MKGFWLTLISKKAFISVVSVLLVCLLASSTVLATYAAIDVSVEESVDEETDDTTEDGSQDSDNDDESEDAGDESEGNSESDGSEEIELSTDEETGEIEGEIAGEEVASEDGEDASVEANDTAYYYLSVFALVVPASYWDSGHMDNETARSFTNSYLFADYWIWPKACTANGSVSLSDTNTIHTTAWELNYFKSTSKFSSVYLELYTLPSGYSRLGWAYGYYTDADGGDDGYYTVSAIYPTSGVYNSSMTVTFSGFSYGTYGYSWDLGYCDAIILILTSDSVSTNQTFGTLYSYCVTTAPSTGYKGDIGGDLLSGYITASWKQSGSSYSKTVNGTLTAEIGSQVTIKASSMTNYTFIGWYSVRREVDGGSGGADDYYFNWAVCYSNTFTARVPCSMALYDYLIAVYEINKPLFWTSLSSFRSGSWSGEGSASSPYLIQSAKDLALLAYNVNSTYSGAYSGVYFRQTCDIDLSGTSFYSDGLYWMPIGGHTNSNSVNSKYRFRGVYDGGGHVITGMKLYNSGVSNSTEMGLFGRIYGTSSSYAIIHDLGIVNSTIDGYNTVGAVVGYAYSYCKVYNCYNTCSVSATGTSVAGGVVGYSYGYSSTKNLIYNCYNTGTITGSALDDVGGILGYGYGTEIYECYNTGTINETVSYDGCTGGIAGKIQLSKIYDCYNSGAVTGQKNVGGIYGLDYATSYVYNCYNRGAVSGSSYIGGISGRGAYLYNNFNLGSVSGSSYVGGVAGYALNIYYCHTSTSSCCGTATTSNCTTGLSSSYAQDLNWYTSSSYNGTTYWSSSYPWSISSSKNYQDYTWFVGLSLVNDGYPALTWNLSLDFATVTVKDDGLATGLYAYLGGSSTATYYFTREVSTSNPDTGSNATKTTTNGVADGFTFDVIAGVSMTFSATYASDCTFGSWTLSGDKTGSLGTSATSNSLSLTANQSVTVTAALSTVTVSVQLSSASGKVTIGSSSFSASTTSASCSLSASGTTSVVVTPEIGYYVSEVTVSGTNADGNSVALWSQTNSSAGTKTFNVSSSLGTVLADTISVVFTRMSYTIIYNVIDTDGSTLSYSATLNLDDTVDFCDVIQNTTGHSFGILWTVTASTNSGYSWQFEDVSTTYFSYMRRAIDENYALTTISAYTGSNSDYIISSNSTSTVTFTLRRSYISYTFVGTNYYGNNTSSYTQGNTGGTTDLTTTATIENTNTMKNFVNPNASTNYYFRNFSGTMAYLNSAFSDFDTKVNDLILQNYYNTMFTAFKNYGYYTDVITKMATASVDYSNFMTLNCYFVKAQYAVSVSGISNYNLTLDGVGTSTDYATYGESETIEVGSGFMNVYYTYAKGTSSEDTRLLAYKVQTYTFSLDATSLFEFGTTLGSNYYYQSASEDDYVTLQIVLEAWNVDGHSFGSYAEPKKIGGVYQITSETDLQWLAAQVAAGKSYSGVKFLQTCDIDVSGISWSPIGLLVTGGDGELDLSASCAFSGTYDGGGYRIIGLTVSTAGGDLTSEESGLGLFGYTNGATIKNLTLDGGSVDGFAYVGAFVGYAVGTTFSNLNNYGCAVSGEEITRSTSSTLIYGPTSGTSLSSVASKAFTRAYGDTFGGIAGYASGCAFSVCSNSQGQISASDAENVGGLVGYLSGGSISQCYSGEVGATLYGTMDASNLCTISDVYWYGSAGYVYEKTNSSNWTTFGGTTVLRAFYW